jgi:hypothetical protein
MSEIPYRLSVELAEFHAELERCGYSKGLEDRIRLWQRSWRRGEQRLLTSDQLRGTEFSDSLGWLFRKVNHMRCGCTIDILPHDDSLGERLAKIHAAAFEMTIELLGDGEGESLTTVVAWIPKANRST